MANTIRGLLPDGTLPSAALAQVQGMVDGLEIPEPTVQGVPIFATLAEAQAWEAENPGMRAVWVDWEATPDPDPDPDPDPEPEPEPVNDGDAAPGTVLTSDDFSGDGPLRGRTSVPTAGGSARTWVDRPNAGSNVSDATTAGGKLVAGTADRQCLLPVNRADVEVTFVLNASNTGPISITLRDGGVGHRYALNFPGNGSVRVQRFLPTGATILPGMQASIGAATWGAPITFSAIGTTISVTFTKDTGEVVTLTAEDADVPTGDYVGVGIAGGATLDDLVVTAR